MNSGLQSPARSQAAFGAALLDPDVALPAGLKAWNGSDAQRRFAVYRNNVIVSLSDALAETFAVVREQVGEAFFSATARAYVRSDPPRSPVLSEYGDGFADWLEGFAPVRELPWLADLARLERARVRAQHAADAVPLAADAVAARLADADALALAVPVLHPSLHVLSSRFAVVTRWAEHQRAEGPGAVEIDRPESALVLRDAGDEVLVLAVCAAEAAFVRALLDGRSLGAALAEAARAEMQDEAFDLPAALARLLRHGQWVGWRVGGQSP